MNRKYLLAAFAVAAAVFLYIARGAVYPLFWGAIFAYALTPAVKKLENAGLGRRPALVVVYLTVILLIILTFSIGTPLFISGASALKKTITDYIAGISLHFPALDNLEGIIMQFHDAIFGYAGSAIMTLFSTLGAAVNVVLGLVLSFYMILDREKIKSSLLALIPKSWRRFVVNVASKTDIVIKQFICGQLGVALAMSVLLFIGLVLLGIRHALLLAAFAGLLEVIPYFGAFLGAAPAVFAAAAVSWQKAIWTTILFIVVQQIEGAYISPKILGDYIGLHPIIVIMAVITGGNLFGLIGMIVAVPACGIIKGIAEEIISALDTSKD